MTMEGVPARFNVNAYANEQTTAVALLEGASTWASALGKLRICITEIWGDRTCRIFF